MIFFQILLGDEDKAYTFGTPFGRYGFLRLPFGLSTAPEVTEIKGTIVCLVVY